MSSFSTLAVPNHVFGRSLIILKAEVSAPVPVLDGKRVLPLKVTKAGVKGHKVAAVYALLNSNYKRGSEGWEHAEFVGITMDLSASLTEGKFETSKMAHVRALSFSVPSKASMEELATQWRNLVTDAGGSVLRPEDYLFDDEDDDEGDWDPEMLPAVSAAVDNTSSDVVSPFDPTSESATATGSGKEELVLNMENVDKVLEEVRPYLIADGGNVAVEDVDTEKGLVFLKLEGACGSCPSSTVTMSMGIERVLKENFDTFREVIQVEEKVGPTELTLEDVQEEFNRLYPAIVAMGGVAKIIGIDAATGVVTMTFRGSNKIRQGLELADRKSVV